MISLKKGSIRVDLVDLGVWLAFVSAILLAILSFVALFTGGWGASYSISNKHVGQDGTYHAEITDNPGWVWFLCEGRTATYHHDPARPGKWWTSSDPLERFLTSHHNNWLHNHFSVREAEVTHVDDRREIGWIHYRATLTLNTGDKVEREYVAKDNDGWYYYPSMKRLSEDQEYRLLNQAYDSRCAQAIFGSTQTVVEESESDDSN